MNAKGGAEDYGESSEEEEGENEEEDYDQVLDEDNSPVSVKVLREEDFFH